MEMKWFRKLNDGHDSLMESCNIPAEAIIVRNEANGIQRFGFFRGVNGLHQYLSSLDVSERCLNEIIRSNCLQKPYFDFDMDYVSDKLSGGTTCDEKKEIVKRIPGIICSAVRDIFPQIKETDILILTSHGDKPGQKKRSMHIIIDRWCFINSRQNKIFHSEVMKRIPDEYVRFFDVRVHGENQSFRMYNCVKYGQTRKMIFSKILNMWIPEEEIVENEEFDRAVLKASLITHVGECEIIYLEDPENVGERDDRSRFCLKPEDIESINVILGNEFFSIRKIKDNIVQLNRLQPTWCEHCNAEHENDNPFLLICDSREVLLNCRKSKKYSCIGQI